MLPALIDHCAWADAEAARAIATLPTDGAERAQATRLYAHLAGAAHVWLSRLQGRAPEHPVWPELSLEDARALADESMRGLRGFAELDAEALAREVAYRTTAGQPFRNTVADVLAHVALHGSHHRGQLALLTRLGGGTPASTDFIFFARGLPAPASPA